MVVVGVVVLPMSALMTTINDVIVFCLSYLCNRFPGAMWTRLARIGAEQNFSPEMAQ